MAMTACYRNFDLQIPQGVSQIHHQSASSSRHHVPVALAATPQLPPPPPQKDYSIPLHVDCSVEYELPNQAKPPVGARVEPLLMIHPCYFRKMESQRRSPFINNMPNSARSAHHAAVSSSTDPSGRRRMAQPPQLPSTRPGPGQRQPSGIVNLKQEIDEYVQRQIVQMSQAAPVQQHPGYPGSYQMRQPATPASAGAWDHHYRMPNSNNNNISHKSFNSQQDCYSSNATTTVVGGSGKKQQYSISNKASCTGTNIRWGDAGLHGTLEKTAAIPRDYHANGPECIPSNPKQPAPSSYGHQQIGKRDAMLSASCNIYNNNSDTQTTDIAGLWKSATVADKTTVPALPRDYQMQQQLLKQTLTTTAANSTTNNAVVASQQQQQRHYQHHQELKQQQQQQQGVHPAVISGKYKQYLRSQRMHPYSSGGAHAITANTPFPQLAGVVHHGHAAAAAMFGQIQQVSCFNV